MGWEALIAPNITTAGGFWTAAFGYAAFFVALWGCILGGQVYAGYPEVPVGNDVKRRTWALKGSMLVHHAFIGPAALIAIFCDGTLLEAFTCFGCEDAAWKLLRDKAGGPSLAAQALMPVTIGYMIADLMLLPSWSLSKGSSVENGLMVMHHVFSLAVWPCTILYNYCGRYVVVLLAYEVSSIFLTLNWMLSTAGMKTGALYKVSGLLFTASFVLVRMVGALPQLLALWHAPPWTFTVVDKVAPGEMMTWQIYATITLILPHALNLFWGVKVVRGFMAVLLKADKSKSTGKEPLLS